MHSYHASAGLRRGLSKKMYLHGLVHIASVRQLGGGGVGGLLFWCDD